MSQKPDQDKQETLDFAAEMRGLSSEPTGQDLDQDAQASEFDSTAKDSAASNDTNAASDGTSTAAGMYYDDDSSSDTGQSSESSDSAQADPPPIPSVAAGASDESEQNLTSQGIPSVTGGGNASNDNKKKGLFLLLLALVLLVVGLIVWFKFFKQPEVAPTEASAPVSNSLTSSRQLAAVELPVAPPEPEKPDEPVEPAAPAEIQPPVLMPPPTAAAGNVDANGDPLPTLEELKFAAPMMGAVQSTGTSGGSYGASSGTASGYGAAAGTAGYDAAYGASALNGSMPAGQGSSGALASQLNAVPTPSSDARIIKQQSLTLSKGTVIECILETRVDTTVPGMTTCVIPRDIYSMNGRILLIERGTKAIGEYQGAVQNGLARIFMLWTELRTPNGVSIQLNSPVADAMGGAGMGGYVDYHWFKRFGNALLFSLISDGFQYIVNTAQENNNNGDVTYENTQNGMDEIIKEAMAQSGNIPPTLIKNQGERVSIFVARDLNFSQVYGVKRGQNHAAAMVSAY